MSIVSMMGQVTQHNQQDEADHGYLMSYMRYDDLGLGNIELRIRQQTEPTFALPC